MQSSLKSKMHTLNLSYAEYLQSGSSISYSKIGKYVVYDQIGRGAFGVVYRGMDDQTKQQVAIKVLDLIAVERQPSQKNKQIQRRFCTTESKLMMLCDSQNVVKCFDVYENRWLKIIVMQYCNGGDLHTEITGKVRIPEKEAIIILKHIINGIAQLHSHRIIHRDLKAENILSHNGIYKIADLGLSKQVGDEEVIGTTVGTITTMAPQVMKRQPYGLKADIWSLGIIFFQMVFGAVPYTSTNAILMCSQIETKKILHIQQFQFNNYKASKEVTKFLREAICVDKNKRLDWKELINHEIFNYESQRLDNEFRLDCKFRNSEIKIYESGFYDQLDESFSGIPWTLQKSNDQMEHTLIRLTQQQASQKMKQLRNDQNELYEWVKSTHLQCLKTQLIYNEIFEVIQKNKLLKLQERSVIELMYLILTRCLNNISVINHKIKHQKPEPLLIKLEENVKKLYQKVMEAWKRYSALLTDQQDKMGSIIADRLRKIFKPKSIQTKDKFLIGIQSIYYTKEQQIQFTDQKYIKHMKTKIITGGHQFINKLNIYLSHYTEINSIILSDLQQRSFQEYIEMNVK